MWWSCCFSASSDDALLSPTNTGGNAKCAGSGGTNDKNDTEPSDGTTTEQNEVGQSFLCYK